MKGKRFYLPFALLLKATAVELQHLYTTTACIFRALSASAAITSSVLVERRCGAHEDDMGLVLVSWGDVLFA